MSNSLVAIVVCGLCLGIVIAEPAMAAPGGRIASAAFETFWGKVLLGALTIAFLPLIVTVIVREKLAERRSHSDLRYMALRNSVFDWLTIQRRVKDCFHRVHSGWQHEDLSMVSDWMTDWYWQNQQLLCIERWKSQGQVNVCDVKKLSRIKPLLFVHRNMSGKDEGSLLVVSIIAKMSDYLIHEASGTIMEGSKKVKEVETIWTFTLENNQWKVSDIDEDSMSLSFARMARELPPIETTLLQNNGAR